MHKMLTITSAYSPVSCSRRKNAQQMYVRNVTKKLQSKEEEEAHNDLSNPDRTFGWPHS